MSEDFRGKTKNVVLARSEVGKSRPTTYTLPAEHHAYGRSDPADAENARQVTMVWVQHTPSRDRVSEIQDIRKINKLASRKGLTNAKQLAEFRKDQDIRLQPGGPIGKPNIIPSDINPGFSYGRKGGASTPIQQVVGGHYAEESVRNMQAQYREYAEQLEKEAPGGKHRIKLTKQAANRISSARQRRRTTAEEQPATTFKLGKFKKVSPRLKLDPLEGSQKPLDLPTMPMTAR
eukprot:TRINITY_DN78664_c0_g1_i1.p1 TRINITY_DN78664_c0_g1~~TRINITY_DN78664_c0_g1_i1.p1  ORF type:complete len:233 (+),score=36.86 TRINITY_DN78664_c0_g1_i1:80-778(+)